MRFSHYDDVVQITPLWKGERFPDGRPKVSDDILKRIRKITLEEAWGPLWGKGYRMQFQGDFKTTHKDAILVGRAITGIMVPKRPDLDETLMNYGIKEEGRRGYFNQWIIDSLVEDDVVVIDMFEKVYEGTFVGGNLSTAIASRTKRGGAIIWGGIRDMEQIVKIPNIQVYHKGNDPTGIGNVTLTGMNCPCRIGNATCLPGDVVLGTMSGVIFIPPHLAEEVAAGAEKSHVRDIFGFIRLDEKVYSTAQIDAAWTYEMWNDFIEWFNTDAKAEEYRHLTWEKELEEAKQRLGKEEKPNIRL